MCRSSNRPSALRPLPPSADNFFEDAAHKKKSVHILNDRVWTVSATDRLGVPLAFLVLILDIFDIARDFLLLGSQLRGSERLSMSRESFRKHAVDFIGPAAVMLDNLVDDVRHCTPS